MAIKRIKLNNFKSFKQAEVQLGNFDVLIGANASGKSNFIQAFRFLRDVANDSLENAISLQGGVHYLRNMNIQTDELFTIETSTDNKLTIIAPGIQAKTNSISYNLSIKFNKIGAGFNIAEDRLILITDFIKKDTRGVGEITISNVNGKLKFELNLPPGLAIKQTEIFPPFFKEARLPPRLPLLQFPFLFVPALEDIFGQIAIYNFDPNSSKKAGPITGKTQLAEDGSNLALILKNVTQNKDRERKFSNLIKDLLPFVQRVGVEKFADRSLLLKLREKYYPTRYLPASSISDGTINIIALITALYFQEEPLAIIEEPERNIHPYLISRVMGMMKEASQRKQVLVTTNNPEIVRHAGLENLLLVARDKEGFSTISRPADKEEIKTFLKNEFGVEELYIQNLLDLPG